MPGCVLPHAGRGAKDAGTFDFLANYSGFQIGLGVASDRMLINPNITFALVIGASLQSRYIDFSDPSLCIYFGDGVGATVLK